ncbi:MAG: cyclic nucleotide-binding domain-containing protein [Luminiphilus sp.]|nr:cyclic nucleotide-binding domain-containing protein [Luminiphilus sp.]
MLTTGQAGEDFKRLNKAAVSSLSRAVDGLDVECRTMEFLASPAAEFKPLPHGTVGRVESGLLAVMHSKTVVSVLEAGDLVLADTDWLPETVTPLLFGSEAGASVSLWNRDALLKAITADHQRLVNWQAAQTQTQSLIYRLNALHIRQMVGLGGQAEIYDSGAIIIRQGDPADDVFSMVEGTAEVLVNEHPVAKINAGELFGTMAALTDSHRNATVVAVGRCSVLRVPKDRFFEIIRTRPEAVQGLLVDMAQAITALNEEVVSLRHRASRN